MLADKAYDANRIRASLRERGAFANIPPKSNRRSKPYFSTWLYRERNLIERFFKLGTIRIVSSDRTDPQLDLKGIDDVQQVSSVLDDARRKERRRRGLHIEQI